MKTVDISIGGKWHFYDIVIAAQNEGYLNTFYTSIYCKYPKIANSQIGKKINLQNRYSNEIDEQFVKSNFLTEIIPGGLQRFRLLKDGEALKLRCELFDKWVMQQLGESDIFHSQDGFCLESAQVAKKNGSKVICDRGIISATYLKELSEIEYEKFGIKKKYADCFISERTHDEHLIADVVLVPTQTVKDSLIAEGIIDSKIKIIPYGVDTDFFSLDEKIIPNKFNVLFVGEISIRKGCHYLLEAWSELSLPSANLILVGKVEDVFLPILTKYQKNVKHVPYVSQFELLDYYKNASVLVLPSLAEGSARVIYEAMACRLPVIYSNMSGSIARNNIDGFEVKIKDKDELKSKIFYFYNNPDSIIEMGEQGNLWVKNFTKENYRANIIKLYNEL